MTKTAPVVTLGEKEFQVVRLTLGVMRAIGVAAVDVPEESPRKREEAKFLQMQEVVGAGIGKTVAELDEIESSSFRELVAAYRTVLLYAGLIEETPKKGEDPAAVPAA
jgi:hypothetical protein